MSKYWIGMGAAGLLGLLLSQSAYALDSQETSEEGVDETSLLITEPTALSEVEQPYATVDEWLEAQTESAIAITNIQLNATETGVEIILETQGQVAPTTSTLGNALIVEIPNAVLTTERFEQVEPAEGIALITAENLPENRVRIAITGIEASPAVTVRSDLQSFIVGITPGIAIADVSDEEAISLVVTAQKTPEDPLDVPISLTVIPRQTLEDAQINDLTDISRNTPNFSFFPTNAGGSDFSYYSIRGLNNFNFLVSQDSVGYYIDDVPFNFGAFLDLGLLDLERVEVLRGPQSTLYGRSSPAGVVNIISRAPTNFSEFRVFGGYGNYNFREVQLSYSNALVPDQLAFRLAGAYEAQDGVFENQTLDRSVGEREQLLGRAQLLWTPSEEWSVSFNTYVNDANNGDPVFTRQDADNPFETFKAVDGFVRLDNNTQALRIGYNGTGFRATSITSRRFSRQEVLAGDSFSPPLDLFRSNIDFSSTLWTQEIRLQSPENADRFTWLLGGYYESSAFDVGNDAFDYTALGATFFGLPAAGQDRVIADLSRTTYAVFGQVDYKPVEPLTLFAGLRFESSNFNLDRQRIFQTENSVTVLSPRVQQEDSSSEVIPRFGLQYSFSPNVMAYATISKGYRPNGFNYRADTEDIRRYQEERTWTYEAGVKSSWYDNRLIANFSIFHNDVQGYQVLLTDSLGFFRNIASANVSGTGFEFEVTAQPLEGLDLVFGLGYVSSRFTSYQNPLTGVDFNNNQVPFAPNITYNAAVQYRAPIGIFARLELQGYGTTFFDDANQVKQDPFVLVNLRLGYEWQDYGIYLFANNLFDTRYITSGFQFPPPNVTAGFGEPVTYGLQVRAGF
jgi:iron complex outermembrane receptor protein